jgi:hypothetical protein
LHALAIAHAQNTVFTYQGRVLDNGTIFSRSISAVAVRMSFGTKPRRIAATVAACAAALKTFGVIDARTA